MLEQWKAAALAAVFGSLWGAQGARAEEDDGGYQQEGETVIVGDHGPSCDIGWELDVDASGDYICKCQDRFWCGDGHDSHPEDPWNPNPPGGGGSDDCSDGSCVCEHEDMDPEWCELSSCAECERAHAACVDEMRDDVAACERTNLKTAQGMCSIRLWGASGVAECISWQIFGRPGQSSTQLVAEGGSVGIETKTEGGVPGVFTAGVTGVATSTSTTTNGTVTIRPHSPPNRDIYQNCEAVAQQGIMGCTNEFQACAMAAEHTGESCE